MTAQTQSLDVIFADLEFLAASLDRAEQKLGLLSDDELAWSSATHATEVLRQRRHTRILLRLVLVSRGAAEGRGTPLPTTAGGKPALPPPAPAFSVSHTRGHALIALCLEGAVGADLEAQRPIAIIGPRRTLIEAAGLALVRAPSDTDPTALFLEAWTALEALAKARGSGIGALLTELGVTAASMRTLAPGETARRARFLCEIAKLDVHRLALPPFFAAVAAPRGATVSAVATLAAADIAAMVDRATR